VAKYRLAKLKVEAKMRLLGLPTRVVATTAIQIQEFGLI
jgi:hypothetical protein